MRRFHIPARYRSTARRNRRVRRLPLALLLVAVLGAWAAFSEWGLSSLSRELTEEAARGHLLACMGEAVAQATEELEAPLAEATYNGERQIAAVHTDTAALNRLKAAVLQRLERSLNSRATVTVPAGSLTGVAILNGRGFPVPVKLNFEGSANVSFHTDFVSAGINQSCHRITMTVQAQVYSQSKRFAVSLEESTTTVLAETVVVGTVPQVAVSRTP